MKKAIIIGATSGIGRELAKVLSREGYSVGISGRRLHLLEELKTELPTQTYLQEMDVSNADSQRKLQGLISEMKSYPQKVCK